MADPLLKRLFPQLLPDRLQFLQPPCEKAALLMIVANVVCSVFPAIFHDGIVACPPMAVSFERSVRLPTICYFSESYWEARAKFRRVAAAGNASLHALEVAPGYYMDIAVLQGSGKGLVVHTSGVHGVEGYAGSGIQIGLLHRLKQQVVKPTVVFVHAVNPFGMAHFRRWNENNVDLNRNALTPEEFRELQKRDPNQFGYVDVSAYINPEAAPSMLQAYLTMWGNIGFLLATKGLTTVKAALVTGTYTEPKGIFYGGNTLQRSHVLLENFLREQGLLTHKQVTWIDVHTGLGKSEEESLIVDSKATAEKVQDDFPHADLQSIDGSDSGDQASGYDHVKGEMARYYQRLFTHVNESSPAVVVTQEFGTVSSPMVARALILENQAYHHYPESHRFWRKFTLDAFYSRSVNWQVALAERGNIVFQQAIRRSTTQEL